MPYQIIFIGDHHDENLVQQWVADLVRQFSREGRHVAIANEWFSPFENEKLKAFASGATDVEQFKDDVNWSKRIGFDFKNYELIYNAVKEQNGSLYGINMSKKFKKSISEDNVTAMTSSQRDFYNHLDLNVTAHQQLVAPFLNHCKQSKGVEECQKRMYRVQVAWDSYMADQSVLLAQKLLKDEKAVLIVFVGSMHLAHGLGVNMRFARQSDLPFVTLLPHDRSEKSIMHGTSDYIFLYDAKEVQR
jgi:uncharacterized iron-regulated protein